MTMRPIDYAQVADHSYENLEPGRRTPGREEQIIREGVAYKVLEHRTSATGYQGTIYQRTDTNEIIVAHRGTEQKLLDGALADGGMLLQRFNLQVADAKALTQSALEIAAEQASERGIAPKVSVTGHSLGGLMAQKTAHQFDLTGQTFNAYGTASLDLRIPEGGSKVINHVMASDPVSAAAKHYGEVRVYATNAEINILSRAGFSNSAHNAMIPDFPLVAAGQSLRSHLMSNFTGPDSVLLNPGTQTLAQANRRMIDEYRSDMHVIREAITASGRGPMGNLMDMTDRLRPPVAPGQSAMAEADDRHSPSPRPRMDQPGHRFYPLFSQAQHGVHEVDRQTGRAPDAFSNYLAGSLAAEMGIAGGTRIDAVMLSRDGSRAFAVQGDRNDPSHLRVCVDTRCAVNTPLEASTRRAELEAPVNDRLFEQEQRQQALGRGM